MTLRPPSKAEADALADRYNRSLTEQLRTQGHCRKTVDAFQAAARGLVEATFRDPADRDTVLDLSNAPIQLPTRRPKAA